MRRFRTVAAVALLACAGAARGMPFHGCTFWQPQYANSSWLCAAFNVLYPGCTITHCSPGGCISYPGALVTGWMPDHFIEVTNRAGESLFTKEDGQFFIQQMVQAKGAWSRLGDVYPAVRTQQEHQTAHSEYSMFFGRTLPMPYGPYGWSLETVGNPFTAGTWYPTCFSAITELAPETWVDRLDASGDRELAVTRVAMSAACTYNPGVAGMLTDLSSWVPRSNWSSCPLYPLNPGLQRLQAQRGKAALPGRHCMGALGPLLPRTGWTDGETYTAAQRVAWRTASLAEDYFNSDVGVALGDKWLMMWPYQVTPPQCFIPGSTGVGAGMGGRPSSFGLSGFPDFQARMPAYDEKGVPAAQGEYVFAVFRPRAKCVEPWDQAAVRLEIAMYRQVHTLECTPFNASMGLPR